MKKKILGFNHNLIYILKKEQRENEKPRQGLSPFTLYLASLERTTANSKVIL